MVIQGKATFIFTNVKWLGHVNIVVEFRLPLHLAIANVVGHCRNFCEVKIVGRERNPKVDSHQKGKDESENEAIFQWLLPLSVVDQSYWVQAFGYHSLSFSLDIVLCDFTSTFSISHLNTTTFSLHMCDLLKKSHMTILFCNSYRIYILYCTHNGNCCQCNRHMFPAQS